MTTILTNTSRRTSGIGLVLVGILSVQWGAAAAKSLFPEAGPGGTVWMRLLFSAFILAVIWRPSRLSWPPWKLGWSAQTVRAVALFGITLGGMNWAFYESLARIPLGAAVTLEFVGPLGLAMVLSRRLLDGVWAAMAVGGILLLTGGLLFGAAGQALDPVGVGLALVAGGFWASYILTSRKVGQMVPGQRGLAAALVVGAILLTPAGLTAGDALLDPTVLAIGVAVAVLSSVIPYAAELEALRRLPTRLFGILLSLEPACAAGVGLLALNEMLAARQWLGIALVCAASLGATLTARDETQEPRSAAGVEP